MSLEDRINDEMYVDTESLLEDSFDRAKALFDIYDDNTVALTDDVENGGREEQILTHLVAWQYIAEADGETTPGLSYDYFYERFDAGESTIRKDFGNFNDAGLTEENEEGNRELAVERLDDVLDRIESAIQDEDHDD